MTGFLKSDEDTNPLENKYPKKNRFQVFDSKKESYDYKPPERPPSTPCQCSMKEGTVFCDIHQCMKSPSLQKLCRTRMDYFEMWENGHGPMQTLVQKIIKKEEEKEIKTEESYDSQEEDMSGFFMGDPEIPSESRGLGDTVAKITKATGIKKMTKTVFGAFNKDCGCRERQSKLNKLFPYKKEEAEKRNTKGFFE